MDDSVGIGNRQFEIRPTTGLEFALIGDSRPNLFGGKAETEQVADNGEIASTPVESGQVKPGGQQGGTGVTCPDVAGRYSVAWRDGGPGVRLSFRDITGPAPMREFGKRILPLRFA